VKGPGGDSRGQKIPVDQIDQVRAEPDNHAQFTALIEDYVEVNEGPVQGASRTTGAARSGAFDPGADCTSTGTVWGSSSS